MALSKWVQTIAYCEQDKFCQAVLLSRMSTGDLDTAPIWDDVTTLTGDMLPDIDIIFGGFPCQDISVAGRGKGLGGERSGLFFEITRLVGELRPSFVFLENVPAITGRGLDRVLGEISSLGYDCRWGMLSAAEVGALHKRERWFLLGYSKHNGTPTTEALREKPNEREYRPTTEKTTGESEGASGIRELSNSDSAGSAPREYGDKERSETLQERDDSQHRTDRQYWPFGTVERWQEVVSTMGKCSDGVSDYVARIKCLGNSVVPCCVREAFKMLMVLQG